MLRTRPRSSSRINAATASGMESSGGSRDGVGERRLDERGPDPPFVVREFDRRVHGRPSGGEGDPEVIQQVVGAADHGGSVADQCERHFSQRAGDGPRQREDLPAQVERMVDGDARPAQRGPLDHDECGRECHDDAVAGREPMRLCRDTRRVLAHHRSHLGDAGDEVGARARVADVDAGAQHRDRAPPGVQSATMRVRVDPVRRSAHDADARTPESTPEIASHLAAERRASARSDDGHAKLRSLDERATDEQRDRRVVQLEDRGRVLVVARGQEPGPRRGARTDDGVRIDGQRVLAVGVTARPARPNGRERRRCAALAPAHPVEVPRRDAAQRGEHGDGSPLLASLTEPVGPPGGSERFFNRLGQDPPPRTPRGRTTPRPDARPRRARRPRGRRRSWPPSAPGRSPDR